FRQERSPRQVWRCRSGCRQHSKRRCRSSRLIDRAARRSGPQVGGSSDEEETQKNRGKGRYQRYPVHRHSARAVGDLYDDHTVDTEGSGCGSSATAVAMLVLALTGSAKLQARDNLNKGVRAFRESHYENAVNYFKQAVELDPDLTTAQIYLATAYSQQYIPGGRSEENDKNAKLAIQTFESVLQRDPNNVNAIAGLASMYQSLRQTDTSQFQKAHD